MTIEEVKNNKNRRVLFTRTGQYGKLDGNHYDLARVIFENGGLQFISPSLLRFV